ncbi:hypothetical protein BC826DRAFT_580343 [Russula brevipes]|nr:hypothetical protein BC826DRAFT_580343 [Russula brevipes]
MTAAAQNTTKEIIEPPRTLPLYDPEETGQQVPQQHDPDPEATSPQRPTNTKRHTKVGTTPTPQRDPERPEVGPAPHSSVEHHRRQRPPNRAKDTARRTRHALSRIAEVLLKSPLTTADCTQRRQHASPRAPPRT